MFIAHAPSGYILAVSILKRIRSRIVAPQTLILTGIAGAVAPDLDMIYFYLIDGHQTHHHKFVTHWPLAWLATLGMSLIWLRVAECRRMPLLSVVFLLGCVLHVLLDSFVGDVFWLAPFSYHPYALFTVPAVHRPWWLNFVLHWSFLVEVGICIWAFQIWRHRSGSEDGRTDA